MKAIDLEKYLRSSGLFKVDENTTMVEIINGTIYNRVPIIYKSNRGWPTTEIRIYVEKFGKNQRRVEFKLGGVNTFANYTLEELDLPTLCKELNKMFLTDIGFQCWKTKELRNYKINNII